MAAPLTIRATGYFIASRGGTSAGEAVLRMKNATHGTLSFGGNEWKLRGDPTAKTFRGTGQGSVIASENLKRQSFEGHHRR